MDGPMSIIPNVLSNTVRYSTEKERHTNVPSLLGNCRMFHSRRPCNFRPAPAQSASHCQRQPQRQGHNNKLHLPPPQGPHHRLRHRPLRRSLAHRSQCRHHPHHCRQPQDWHPRRPRRHLHVVYSSQQEPVAPHHQQEDRRMGHPLSRRQRPRPHTHDIQANVVFSGKHVHLLREHQRKHHRTPRQMGYHGPVRNCQSTVTGQGRVALLCGFLLQPQLLHHRSHQFLGSGNVRQHSL